VEWRLLLFPEGETGPLPAVVLLFGGEIDIAHLAFQFLQLSLQVADLVLLGPDVAVPHHVVEDCRFAGGGDRGRGKGRGASGVVDVGEVA
jgi:hypothetical protein